MKLHAKSRFARLWIMLLFTSFSMVSVSAVSSALSIGQRYQGGIVFYVDGTGQHGLVAATRDLPDRYDWQGAKEAGERFVDGGFSDWYLPGKWELNELYTHKNAVGGFALYTDISAVGGVAPGVYWSSTEYDPNFAWAQVFFVNRILQYCDVKGNVWRVRPIRSF